jgi:hypothetical protein
MSLSDDPRVDRQAEELGLPDGGVELGWREERRRSASVLLGLVTGIPSRRVHSEAVSVEERCRTIPLCLLFPAVLGTVTWTAPDPPRPLAPESRRARRMPHNSAALKWLRTAPSPQASTAAVHLPCSLSLGCPTA